MTDTFQVRELDFNQSTDAAAYVRMLDAYARDPMGANAPLPDEVGKRVVGDLAANPAAYGLLAERSGTPVGFATCLLGYSTFRARSILNIHDIAVVPEARGQGIGTALLDAVSDLARRLDCCKVTLEVREANRPARQRYAAAGFAPAECNLFLEKWL